MRSVAGPDEARDLRIRADGDDASVADRDRLCDAIPGIDGQHAPARSARDRPGPRPARCRPRAPTTGSGAGSSCRGPRGPNLHASEIPGLRGDAMKAGRVAWWVLALIAAANFGNFYVYDSIGPVAELLVRQRGFQDTQIGLLNAVYSLPNIVLLLFGGLLVDRFGAARMLVWTAAVCLGGRAPDGARHRLPRHGLPAGSCSASAPRPSTSARSRRSCSASPAGISASRSRCRLALGRAGALRSIFRPTWMPAPTRTAGNRRCWSRRCSPRCRSRRRAIYWRLDRDRGAAAAADAVAPRLSLARPAAVRPGLLVACSRSACCGTR